MDRFCHYIQPATRTSLPRSHTFLHVATVADQSDEGWRRRFRVGTAVHRASHAKRGWAVPRSTVYPDVPQLWGDLERHVNPGHRHVVWTYHLQFALRASNALEWLAAMGWDLEGIALDHMGGWARFSREKAALLFVDLHAWLPTPLDRLAFELKLPVPAEPRADATDSAWVDYSSRHCEVIGVAATQLLDLIETADMGPFKPTGSGQAYSCWRKRFLTHRPLVHDDIRLLDLERRAAWTGRCEVWRHGVIDGESLSEWDLSNAYCQIAADVNLPCVRIGSSRERDLGRLLDLTAEHSVLARVIVRTETPLVPSHDGEQIVWPVGEFETTLWDPELVLLEQHRVSVEVLDAHVYRSAPVLKAACEWILDKLHAPHVLVGPVERRMLKHWARALIGRMALRYREWELYDFPAESDVSLGYLRRPADSSTREVLQIGRKRWTLEDLSESVDSLPQITGYVMSECRRRLWHLMAAAGFEHTVYCDTDCLIVTGRGERRLQERSSRPGWWPMHLKGRYRRAEILAPRMLVLDDERRTAGIPLAARMQHDGRISGEVHDSLRESLWSRDTGSVLVRPRTFTLNALDRRRTHLADGGTAPITVFTATDGCRRIEV